MKKILNRECKFALHIPAIENVREDTHMIKEVVQYDDGTTDKKLTLVSNYERPFYITKPHFQNHNDKKESELLERVNEYKSTESDIRKNIASRLGPRYAGLRNLRQVYDSPYVYGVSIPSTAIIKNTFKTKYPDFNTPYDVAALDIEAEVGTGPNGTTGMMTIISVVTEKHIYTAVNKQFLTNDKDFQKKLKYIHEKYIPDIPLKQTAELHVEIMEDEISCLKYVMKHAHEQKPDFMAVWNIDYDLPKLINICLANNVKPEDIFSDPSIPENLRYFKYVEGMRQSITESGKFKPTSPEEQWHSVKSTASFHWIDAMSSFRYVRVGGKSIPGGFSLDNILEKVLGEDYKKLKFGENDIKYKGADWHIYMSKYKQLEYVDYNIYDCMSMLELDRKTKDLSVVVPLFSGISDFTIFNSGPKKIVDALHYFYLNRGRVLGVKPNKINDDKILGLGKWIKA